jgi:RNA polymerase sigma-70 factor (ECF subfamily)
MDHGASSYRRYLNGDNDAFREIVSAYFDSLVFFVDRFVHDYAAAEDIALDVFTYLVVNKHRYHFGVSLKTYLFMLGRSRALDYIRHRQKLSLEPLSEAQQLASDEPGPEELVLADERRRAVNRALAQLDEPLRLAVHLVYFEQLSAREAGKVLKKNEKQIYNLLYRAKQQLRSILKEEGEDFHA